MREIFSRAMLLYDSYAICNSRDIVVYGDNHKPRFVILKNKGDDSYTVVIIGDNATRQYIVSSSNDEGDFRQLLSDIYNELKKETLIPSYTPYDAREKDVNLLGILANCENFITIRSDNWFVTNFESAIREAKKFLNQQEEADLKE